MKKGHAGGMFVFGSSTETDRREEEKLGKIDELPYLGRIRIRLIVMFAVDRPRSTLSLKERGGTEVKMQLSK